MYRLFIADLHLREEIGTDVFLTRLSAMLHAPTRVRLHPRCGETLAKAATVMVFRIHHLQTFLLGAVSRTLLGFQALSILAVPFTHVIPFIVLVHILYLYIIVIHPFLH